MSLSLSRRLIVTLGVSAALTLLAGAFGASQVRADDTKYYFLLDDIILKNDAPELLDPLIRKQAKKFVAKHARLVSELPEGAPDPRAEPAKFEKFVKKSGIEPYGIRLEIISYEQEVEPNPRKSGNIIKVAISMRVLGVTLSKSTFGFTGEGSATIKAEVGKRVRKRDIKFTNDDALVIAVGEAMDMAVKRLDKKRAEFKKKFRKKKRRKRRKKRRARKKKR